jgi:hypothetical protein
LFYQNLIPTNGWTMEQLDPLEGNSYTCNVCVILSNGKEKVRLVWQPEINHAIILTFNPPEFY